jgi:hypothetical protein
MVRINFFDAPTQRLNKVGAGGTAQLSSGQVTSLQGAVVSGQKVVADIGGAEKGPGSN